MKTNNTDKNQRSLVREAYGKIAQSGGSCCGGSSCCGSSQPQDIAAVIGYSSEELTHVPDNANMGLSCGNPTTIASLREGETVLDLGCGGGFDVFIAARKVGASGKVIGVDMTPDMISLARKNATFFFDQTGLSNVDIRLGEIEHLPVADSSVDVVISNCVINLSTDKQQVWREIARVLRPGGRVAISDIGLLKPLPESVRTSVELYVGCIAGAVELEETKRMMREAGFTDITILSHANYLDVITDGSNPLYQQIMEGLPEGTSIGDFVTSVTISGKN